MAYNLAKPIDHPGYTGLNASYEFPAFGANTCPYFSMTSCNRTIFICGSPFANGLVRRLV